MATVRFLQDKNLPGRGDFRKGQTASLPFAVYRELERDKIVENVVHPVKKNADEHANDIGILKSKLDGKDAELAALREENAAFKKANAELAEQVKKLLADADSKGNGKSK